MLFVTGSIDSRKKGCFIDKDDRDLRYAFISRNNMTIEMCLQHCFDNDYKFAGVQVGIFCVMLH